MAKDNYQATPPQARPIRLHKRSAPQRKQPSVYQIAVLANTLHGLQSQYHLWDANRYHFSGMLYTILKELYHPHETVMRVRYEIWKRTGIPLFSPPPIETILSVIDDYRVDLENFEAEVQERHNKNQVEAEVRAEQAEARVKALEEELKAYKNAQK
ncbi:hypothetical protein JR316_0011822 [Psilocybe cubensis]|uniref:Uncharacterized protein n=2 Tax=Psilocybe cubensis TaxID=181762 RepID=A0A8H7XL29_PSICU|nr:hypothetical protein JR316_0011822 [Psilocybe cubensis]KAH9476251.1 hypothetical protein JR316_0011822 [Psilocybe cubensis]